jgi:hypothetical protein
VSNPLTFIYRPVPEVNPNRMVYTATDRNDYLYTLGLDVTGWNGFVAVYDPVTLSTLYARTYFDARTHADILKRHLQEVADTPEFTPGTAHREKENA